jgi:hypothetical protein
MVPVLQWVTCTDGLEVALCASIPWSHLGDLCFWSPSCDLQVLILRREMLTLEDTEGFLMHFEIQ